MSRSGVHVRDREMGGISFRAYRMCKACLLTGFKGAWRLKRGHCRFFFQPMSRRFKLSWRGVSSRLTDRGRAAPRAMPCRGSCEYPRCELGNRSAARLSSRFPLAWHCDGTNPPRKATRGKGSHVIMHPVASGLSVSLLGAVGDETCE